MTCECKIDQRQNGEWRCKWCSRLFIPADTIEHVENEPVVPLDEPVKKVECAIIGVRDT